MDEEHLNFLMVCAKHGLITGNRLTATEFQEKHLRYMDIRPRGKEDSLELARELLIAISNCVPDKVLHFAASENLVSKDTTVVNKADGAEKFRSKLISISYVQSLDGSGTMSNGHA